MPGFIDLVAGARPNLMKLAPVDRGLRALGGDRVRVVNTGQHYDDALSRGLVSELGIPAPEVDLEAGSGSHGAQTARVLERYERLLLEERPTATVVFGDVNSTLGCALAAAKLGVPVVHVEAGLRSHERAMPEEINRRVTDAVTDLFLVTEPAGVENLRREGACASRIRLVGNTMIDTLVAQLPRARERGRASSLGLEPGGFALLTLHRAANVDDAETLARLVDTVLGLSEVMPIVFPVHPRTREALGRAGLGPRLADAGGMRTLGPQPYLDNLSLLADSAVVLTDSGGLQAEAAYLRVPCLTLRERTEHLVTVDIGGNRPVGTDPMRIGSSFLDAIEGRWPQIGQVPLWDGKAGERAARAIREFVCGVSTEAPTTRDAS